MTTAINQAALPVLAFIHGGGGPGALLFVAAVVIVVVLQVNSGKGGRK